MKKRKKLIENFFDYNDKLIGFENYHKDSLLYNDTYKINNIDYLIIDNIKTMIKSFTLIKNKTFTKLLSFFNFNNNLDKYNFIKSFNYKYNLLDLYLKKLNNYFNIYNKQEYIEHFDFFIGLIKDDNCIPFWNNNIKKVADKIFLPINSELKILNKPNTFNYTNWFETEHYINKNSNNNFEKIEIDKQRNFNKFYVDKITKKNKYIIKSIKVKLFLNQEQKEYLTGIYGAYRYYYNRAIQYINNYDKKTNNTFYFVDYNDDKTKKIVNLNNVKSKFTHITMRKYIKKNHPKWINELKTSSETSVKIQSHLIDLAFKEACDNYSKCIEKYKKNNKPFKLKLKTKKNKYQTLNLESCMFKLLNKKNKKNKFKSSCVLFPGIKKEVGKKLISLFTIKIKENLSNLDICDSSITCNKTTNEYYLNLNYHDDFTRDAIILKNKKICSIDPGLSCLLNVYSDNEVHFIGKKILPKINKLCNEIDIITSVMNLKKALGIKIKYLDNLKTELHNKAIKFLISKYGKIIIPPLDSQGMSKKFNSKIARSLYNISYSKFMEKLKHKCKEYDIELIMRPEYYTSKTCSRCGCINHGLKLSDRIYKCIKCNLSINRDLNASRNIMLRNNIMVSKCELPP